VGASVGTVNVVANEKRNAGSAPSRRGGVSVGRNVTLT
jgi:hypothetical protein